MTAVALALGLIAAEAAPGIWGQPVVLALLTLIGVIVTAGVAALANVYVKRLNRDVDDATTAKTLAEAEKARVDVHGREVEIARGLLDEIRKELERVRADQDRARAEQDRMREDNDKRHRELAAELERVHAEQQQLRRDLDDHIPWDRAAHQILQESRPDFPAPPPIGGR